jgi:hypothetical protein
MSAIFRNTRKELGNREFIGSSGRVGPDSHSVITFLSVAESLRLKKFAHELEMAKQSGSGLSPEPDKVDQVEWKQQNSAVPGDYENYPHKRNSSDGFF